MIGRDVPWSGRGRGRCKRTTAMAQAAGGSRPSRTRGPAVPTRARLLRRTATTRTPSPSARRQGVPAHETRPAPETRAGTGTRAAKVTRLATGRATTATRMDTRARAATGTRAAATETKAAATAARAAEPDPAG